MKNHLRFLFCITFLLPSLVLAQLPNPVGHWTFDEGSGETTADVSGNGNDGTLWSDGVFWSTDTPTGHGYSLEFAGKTGAVHIGDPDTLKIIGDITLAAWIKTGPATESWHNIIVKGHGTGENVLRVDGNGHPTQIWCGSYDNADHMVKSEDLTDDQLNIWIHVVGVYSTDLWLLYINGEWVAEAPDAVGAVSADRPWAIGARASLDGTYPSERHFEGLIDDARIYNVALSADEVNQLYTTLTAVNERSRTVPTEFTMSQNYPNPFNPTTQISYTIPRSDMVKLSVYNLLGSQMAVLVNEWKNAGTHTVSFDATNLTSGMYVYKLECASTVMAKKMLVLK